MTSNPLAKNERYAKAYGFEGLLDPNQTPGRSAELARALASGPWQDPDRLTARLLRVSEALGEHGGVDAVESASDGLDALGEGLVRLAPGLGPATVLRFLRPLRGVWADAADTPATPAALAAATCLGWAAEGAATLALPDAAGMRPADLESALERLGAAACRSGRSARCPLAEACPGRDH
jgi:hypothetical protein